MDGGSLSKTVTENSHTLTFKNRSRTVYLITVVPIMNEAGGKYWLGEYTADSMPVPLMIVGVCQPTIALGLPASVVTVCEGGHSTLGGVVKVMTVKVNEHLAWFPDVSTAEAMASYDPASYCPGLRVTELDRISTLSVKVGRTHVTFAARNGGSQYRMNELGQVILGGSRSSTTTEKLHVEKSPAAFEAMYLTEELPTGNAAPRYRPGGLVMYCADVIPMVSEAAMKGQFAIAVARPESVLKTKLDCCGQVNVGGTVEAPAPSLVTVPVNVHETLLFEESRAV